MYKILYDFTCYCCSFGGDAANSFKKTPKNIDVKTLCSLHHDLMHVTEFRPLVLSLYFP